MEKLIETVLNSRKGSCRFEVDGMTFELRVIEDNNIPLGKENRSAIKILREHDTTEVPMDELEYRATQEDARQLLHQWIKEGAVEYVGNGKYRKIEN